jgi:hypothetical protein
MSEESNIKGRGDANLLARPAAARKRYSLAELLRGSEAARRLSKVVAWAREGGAVGREIE